jgi:hypothetical protein
MIKKTLAAIFTLVALAGPATAANCEQDFDAITKAISGPLTMEGGHRAAMMRMALSGYDHCMSGDSKSSANIQDTLMRQLRENLGGK